MYKVDEGPTDATPDSHTDGFGHATSVLFGALSVYLLSSGNPILGFVTLFLAALMWVNVPEPASTAVRQDIPATM